ncbi:DspFAvrF family protein [Dickeya chrysanthemi Ech1591]|uniref:DspFAvrF family protein n=1 Tax=Dickeya chrysanthemi (strain Ech1591) TaxID=561229 RepID=C6CHG8_DICC1|nr:MULTISPECIES: type III secretion system chaperone [Dickeya]ACT06869.1 DspFAvrF family protein [Dickeya chrysanthemi Ech1591]TYL41061.1 DspFAvrF family protein [Dickeya sp. ws52]WJM83676.1 type III secretion system chaperone [Dickeya chrysanthemi]
MTSAQQQAARLLQHFSQFNKTRLTLNNGICVLNGADGREAAVIEVPAQSDNLLLHCQVVNLKGENRAAIYRLMLLLNFEMAAMRGCWLALDEFDNLRLCSQYPLDKLDEPGFNALLNGYIRQVAETRSFIEQTLAQANAA